MDPGHSKRMWEFKSWWGYFFKMAEVGKQNE